MVQTWKTQTIRTTKPKQKEPIWIKLPLPFFLITKLRANFCNKIFICVAVCINIDENQSYIKQQWQKKNQLLTFETSKYKIPMDPRNKKKKKQVLRKRIKMVWHFLVLWAWIAWFRNIPIKGRKNSHWKLRKSNKIGIMGMNCMTPRLPLN
jgi:hypothetical protein